MRIFFILVLLSVLVQTAVQADESEWEERRSGDLGVLLPSGSDWQIQQPDPDVWLSMRIERMTNGDPKIVHQVIIAPHELPEDFSSWLPKDVSADYLRWEIENMQLEGVEKGEYDFLEAFIFEEQRGDFSLFALRNIKDYVEPWHPLLSLEAQELYLVFLPNFGDTATFYKIFISASCFFEECTISDLDLSRMYPLLDDLRDYSNLSEATERNGQANTDAIFQFHRDFIAKAGHGILFDDPEIICTVDVELPGTEGLDTSIVFLAEKGMGAEVWGLFDFPLTNMSSFWTGGEFNENPDNPQTSEWGWFYDRNGDGWIDWISYINGSLAVLPEGGLPEGFPNFLDGEVPLNIDQLAFLLENGRVVYRHIIDVDFDQEPDHLLVVPVSQVSGWHEGAMLFSVRGPEGFNCMWQSEYDAEEQRPCLAEDGAFVTRGQEEPVRRAEPPLEGLFLYWLAVTKTAGNCEFGVEGIVSHP